MESEDQVTFSNNFHSFTVSAQVTLAAGKALEVLHVLTGDLIGMGFVRIIPWQ